MGSVVAVDGLSAKVRVDGCGSKWAGWVGRLAGVFFWNWACGLTGQGFLFWAM